jgi:hypothetical protein
MKGEGSMEIAIPVNSSLHTVVNLKIYTALTAEKLPQHKNVCAGFHNHGGK